MKTPLRFLMMTVAALTLCTGTALAKHSHSKAHPASASDHWAKMVAKYDTDKDGKISLAEYTAVDEHFDKLDANHDGVVSADEMKAKANANHAMNKMDANHDGQVTKDELAASRTASFKKMDKNGDGFIDKDESEAHSVAHASKSAAKATTTKP